MKQRCRLGRGMLKQIVCNKCGEKLYLDSSGNKWEWNKFHEGFKAHLFFCDGK